MSLTKKVRRPSLTTVHKLIKIMTTIAQDVAAKFAVAFVAVAMIFTLFATPAQAQEQSIEDLQALINSLMAQISELEGGVSGGDSMMSSSVCPYTWTRDLSQGSEGADVMKLQQFLNDNPDTRVAATGAGSAGMETMFFGPATAAAVSKFQVAYRAEVLTPAGLVNPTGYFGPSTRAKANALCVAAPVMDDEDDGVMDDEDEDEDDTDMSLSGEASLDTFEIDGADEDEIEEGKDDQVVAELTVEFEDGDAEISRIDVKFVQSGAEAADAFEAISLWVDGDKVAEQVADDEDDYQSDEQTMRFSGLDIVAMEDEEVEILVAVSTQNGLDSEELGTWTVSVESMRFFDADGVATTETTGFDAFTDTETFTIEEEGTDDELTARTNSNDPDATTLPVEDDSDSDEYTVFIFSLDTDDSDNDIELDRIDLEITTVQNTTAADAGFNDLVDDAELVIGGVSIDDYSVTSGDATTAGTVTVSFDVDGDVVLDAGEEVDVELVLTFNSLPTDEEGATIQAAIAGLSTSNIDAEGADNLGDTQLSGSATGEVHTLRTEGLILTIEDVTTTISQEDQGTSGDVDVLEAVFEFEVTAFEEDFFTDEDADVVNYRLLVDGVAAPAASSSATLTIRDADDAATADEKLSEGQAVSYTFTVETDESVSGSVEVVIDGINYSADDNNTEELTVSADPEDDWTSSARLVN